MIPKFRAWDNKNGKMIYAGELYLFVFGCYKDDVWVHDVDKNHNILTRDIMQSTGLKDKNGVKIYEGDIVKMQLRVYDELELFVVKTKAGRAARVASGSKSTVLWRHHRHCEVVGNRWENPELMEVAE